MVQNGIMSPDVLHGPKTVAALKLEVIVPRRHVDGRSPRSEDRGRIEARARKSPCGSACRSPRSEDRGRIEARLQQHLACTDAPAVLHGPKTVAALKLSFALLAARHWRRFSTVRRPWPH